MEALQKMSDAPLRKCPACGKSGLEKLVSAASFRLKGGGWYETDFKTSGKKQLADSDSGNASGGDKEAKAEKSEAVAKPAEPRKNDAAKTEAKSGSTQSSKPEKASKSTSRKKSSR